MWLVKVQIGDVAESQEFECMVCDRKTRRTVPHEQNGPVGAFATYKAANLGTTPVCSVLQK
jgi:hypothetical protein